MIDTPSSSPAPGHRYASRFATLAERGEGMFVPFLMLGDPTPRLCARLLDALVEGGADAIEVGIPFSDPTADGPTIQAAASRALSQGVTPPICLALLQDFRSRHPNVPVGILTYANLVMHRPIDAFYRRAAEAGVDSVLVADVPVIEAGPFSASARAHGIAPILIAPPNLSRHSLRRLPTLCDGYTYCVTRSGVTGVDAQLELDHHELFQALCQGGAPPPLLGFGISRPDHVREALASGAAGAISGSAVVRLAAKGTDAPQDAITAVRQFVHEMKAATRRAG
ncbi:MAG: tryptophan synthase subunit alpha [Nannocystaceae bacterium]